MSSSESCQGRCLIVIWMETTPPPEGEKPQWLKNLRKQAKKVTGITGPSPMIWISSNNCWGEGTLWWSCLQSGAVWNGSRDAVFQAAIHAGAFWWCICVMHSTTSTLPFLSLQVISIKSLVHQASLVPYPGKIDICPSLPKKIHTIETMNLYKSSS